MQEMHALKSNFVSTVSHELRTPLTAIRAYVDTLLAAAEARSRTTAARHFLTIDQRREPAPGPADRVASST